jgi:2-polyprenyl-6-methoxyphenol hydroxylase-like FAD-dependent oxidoreductase
MLIEVLYDKILDKSRVLTDQRVQSIRNGVSDVTVTTTTGRKFTGNIVVGADGIHSTVRQEMWKEAQKIDPSWIDPSEASGMYTATNADILADHREKHFLRHTLASSVYRKV